MIIDDVEAFFEVCPVVVVLPVIAECLCAICG
jgi:hypothetical protein